MSQTTIEYLSVKINPVPCLSVIVLKIPRLVIAGASSGVGKTVTTTGLIGALARRGLKVQPFKIGPDYIDPSYHTRVSGNPSRNLDCWLMPKRVLLETFTGHAAVADIAIIEGVMGLFDGMSGQRDIASTAQIAKLLKAPVILVVDAAGMGRSAGALALGYKLFDKELRLGGVILNRISSKRHLELCRKSIEHTVRVPVLGGLPKNDQIRLKERHLGLIPALEIKNIEKAIDQIVTLVTENLDLDRLIQIGKDAINLPIRAASRPKPARKEKIPIGIALDEAFSFYYPDALELLEREGASIQYVSPIHDGELPPVSGMYLGGGFPEIQAAALASNETVKFRLRGAIQDGMPTFAECGGLMYLTKSISDLDGSRHSMVGVLDADTVMERRLTLGYTMSRTVRGNILTRVNERIPGHEFHYSRITDIPRDGAFAYRMERGSGIDGVHDGWTVYSLLAAYSHTHLAGREKLARRFMAECIRYGRR